MREPATIARERLGNIARERLGKVPLARKTVNSVFFVATLESRRIRLNIADRCSRSGQDNWRGGSVEGLLCRLS